MAKHNIYFDIPEAELGKRDANFYIYRDNEKLGQITISKGGLEYIPYKKKKPLPISWSDFDKLVKQHHGLAD